MLASRRQFLGLSGGTARASALIAVPGAGCLSKLGVTCEICRDACEAGAVTLPPRIGASPEPRVADSCTGCAACIEACPANAIQLLSRERRHD